jgi:hypothetical protein
MIRQIDADVRRCTCGAWVFTDTTCAVCEATPADRGVW